MVLLTRPVNLAAHTTVGHSTLDGRAEQPVGHREEEAEQPDAGADGDADLHLAELPHRVERRQEAVDAERHQREEAGVFVAFAEDEGHLAGPVAEDPVVVERSEAEKRNRQHEEYVGKRQVPDIVVADGSRSNSIVLCDYVDDQRISDDPKEKRYHVEDHRHDPNLDSCFATSVRSLCQVACRVCWT